MNRAVPTMTESAEDLNRLLNAESDSKRAQRLQLLYLFASQQVKTRKDAAAMLGVHRETGGAWLDRSAARGFDAMLEIHGAPGKAPSLPPEVETTLREARSRPTGVASYGESVDWLWQQHGIRRAYSTVHTLVRDKRKARPKVARRSKREKKRVRLNPSKPRLSNGSARPFPPATPSP